MGYDWFPIGFLRLLPPQTFEVCFEYPSGNAYELVAHLPDRDNNYLGPALATLERNT